MYVYLLELMVLAHWVTWLSINQSEKANIVKTDWCQIFILENKKVVFFFEITGNMDSSPTFNHDHSYSTWSILIQWIRAIMVWLLLVCGKPYHTNKRKVKKGEADWNFGELCIQWLYTNIESWVFGIHVHFSFCNVNNFLFYRCIVDNFNTLITG